MAKRFAGFTPEQIGKIIPEMQGMQADEQALFLASKPGASASERLAKMTIAAQKRIGMADGGLAQAQSRPDLRSRYGTPQPSTLQEAPFDEQAPLWTQGIATQGPENNPAAQIGRPYGPRGGLNTSQLPQGLNTGQLPQLQGFGQGTGGGQGPLPTDPSYTTPRGGYNMSQGPDSMNRSSMSRQEAPLTGTELNAAQQNLADSNAAVQAAMAAQAADPSNEDAVKAVIDARAAANNAKQAAAAAYTDFKTTEVPTTAEFTASATQDPSSITSKADVVKISDADAEAGKIAAGTGQANPNAPVVTTETAATAEDVAAPTAEDAVTYTPLSVESTTQDVLDRLEAATGKPSDQALVDAQSMTPQDLAQLGLSAAQIADAQRVQATDPRTLQEGEMISGSTVDMDRVKSETNFAAATGVPSSDATVKGQLTSLMEDFEGNSPPAWAAGAMRAATATMAARGLGASSMAGQAIVQAAMEAALPIAVQDSQTSAKFELTNLSNRQQTAMFAAEKRAEFLGLEFTQSFQTRVANSAKISEIANINFTSEQQIALENARMAQSVDLSNLTAANAKVMADSAAMTQLDLTNLNNRQQAQVQNAKSFLDMDMQNLANEQQTTLFKTQAMTSALLSDQAAENASKQFNASSENQTAQFFSNLSSQVSMFNNEQTNAMNNFNAGETNAVSKFNAAQKAARTQFNSTNGLIVAQANAAWSQAITTSETAAQNQANRDSAIVENEFTMTAYNNVIQEERDLISYAFSSSESVAERQVRIQIASIQAETSEQQVQAQVDMAKGAASGALKGKVVDLGLQWLSKKVLGI